MENHLDILKSTQLSIGEATLRSDGILTLEPDPSLVKDYNMPLLVEMKEVLIELSDGKPRPFLCDNRFVLAMLNKAELNYVEEHLEKFASSAALIESSQITRIIASTFFQIKKPKVPFRMFKQKEDAIEWLKTMLD